MRDSHGILSSLLGRAHGSSDDEESPKLPLTSRERREDHTCYLTHPGSLQFQELLLTFRTYIWFFSNLHGLLMNSVAFLCFLFHFKYLMPLLSQVLGCLNSILFSITSADTVNRF